MYNFNVDTIKLHKNLPREKSRGLVQQTVGDVLCIRSLETGEEQEFKLKLKQIELPRWSPDNRSVLIAGKGNKNLWKLYQGIY